MIYIGLPQWSHPKWVRLGITSLEEYARHFNCVEGNTTLYSLANLIMVWKSAIHSFSPKGKRNKRLIAVYISAALIG